jgi:hypothetical protein|tara:strand:+ start:1409 stop:1984 length:576 start_codon:yes stop_codon:yes gene_type:complete
MTTTTKKKKTTAATIELPRNPFVFEVLDLVSKQRSKAKKIEVLKKYEDLSLKIVLIWNFDETTKSLLPVGEVPYSGFEDQVKSSGSLTAKISEETRRMHETDSFSLGSGDKNGHTTIRREAKNFYHFVKGGNDGLNAIRRETMFINILEGLHPLEAEILCLVKDKKLDEKYKITKEIVAEAYPDIQWGGRS